MENKLLCNVIRLLACCFLISCSNNQNNNDINVVNNSLYQSNNNTKQREEKKLAHDFSSQKQKQILKKDNLIQKKDQEVKASKKVIISELSDNISNNNSASNNLTTTTETNLKESTTTETNLKESITTENNLKETTTTENNLKESITTENNLKETTTANKIKKIDEENTKAIIAALEMLSKKKNEIIEKTLKKNKYKSIESLNQTQHFSQNKFKVSALIPLSGNKRKIGQDIMMGLEQSFFSGNNNNIEIKYFDSSSISDEFLFFIKNQKPDIIIGPVFSERLHELKSKINNIEIPILSFSNNKKLKAENIWLLGKISEDEIEHIIDFGIKTGVKNYAIMGENSSYSKTLINIAEEKLTKIGISKKIIIIENDVLNDRNKLRNKIKLFSGWKKSNNDTIILPKPKYDGILFVGSNEFILKVSPLLSYYDLGSDRVTYLGNSQFRNNELVNELSLDGVYFSSNEELFIDEFYNNWKNSWGGKPTHLSILAFDIAEFTKKLSVQKNITEFILRKEGHEWLTGKLIITKDGLNRRELIINKIENKKINKIYID